MAITRIGNPAIADQRGVNFRNIIINGGMDLAQRSTSASSITSSGYHALDRHRLAISSLGTWTISQDTDVPSAQGFAKSMKFDCTTADASPSASDVMWVQHRIEGQNLQYLKKGTASAESLTLSFWVKSNKTGTYIAELEDTDNSRHIAKSYIINSASTWEKKTITFAGDTTGTLTNDNNTSLELHFYLGAGTNYTSGTLATSWASNTDANRAVGQVNLADSTSNEWYVTGVQLEAGQVASDFEFLPFDVNERRCHRYFQIINARGGSGVFQGSTAAVLNCSLTTELRAGASFSAPSSLTNAIDQWATSSRTPTSITQYDGNTKNIVMVASGMSGATTGHPAVLIKDGFKLDAEL
jgi:hypothetical protein